MNLVSIVTSSRSGRRTSRRITAALCLEAQPSLERKIRHLISSQDLPLVQVKFKLHANQKCRITLQKVHVLIFKRRQRSSLKVAREEATVARLNFHVLSAKVVISLFDPFATIFITIFDKRWLQQPSRMSGQPKVWDKELPGTIFCRG